VGPMLLGACSSSSSHFILGEGGGGAHEMRDEWGLCAPFSLGPWPVLAPTCGCWRWGGGAGTTCASLDARHQCMRALPRRWIHRKWGGDGRMQVILARYGRSIRVSGWLMVVRRDWYARGLSMSTLMMWKSRFKNHRRALKSESEGAVGRGNSSSVLFGLHTESSH
jgi:hypothetical protein